MNSKIIAATVVALAGLTSISAFARDSQDFFPPATTSSTTTRAQVQAEYFTALKDGTLTFGTDGAYVGIGKYADSSTTRAQVRAEAVAALQMPSDSESLHGN
jgi:hypothetical protein